MPSNLAINDELLEEAQRVGNKNTKKATVNEALMEYIARRKRIKALALFGKIEMDTDFDYKKDRQRR